MVDIIKGDIEPKDYPYIGAQRAILNANLHRLEQCKNIQKRNVQERKRKFYIKSKKKKKIFGIIRY